MVGFGIDVNGADDDEDEDVGGGFQKQLFRPNTYLGSVTSRTYVRPCDWPIHLVVSLYLPSHVHYDVFLLVYSLSSYLVVCVSHMFCLTFIIISLSLILVVYL